MLDLIAVADEIAAALDEERAVVALETTLVAHGFPAPSGVEVGLASEAAVRAAGAVPATIGVLDGRIPSVWTLRPSSSGSRPTRASSGPRDLAACAAQGAVGATTVGGTLTAAAAVGIRFMGTGGLGGVHRGFPTPPDVSADLGACARVPALIASSGVKSLLDVPATVELLETLGVPVLGYRVGHAAALLCRRRRPARLGPGRESRGRPPASPTRTGDSAATRCSWDARRTRASTWSRPDRGDRDRRAGRRGSRARR